MQKSDIDTIRYVFGSNRASHVKQEVFFNENAVKGATQYKFQQNLVPVEQKVPDE